MEDVLVSDVQLTTDQGRITVLNLPDQPGECSAIFQAVAAGGIVVDMIVQNLSGGLGQMSFSVPQPDLDRGLATSVANGRGEDRPRRDGRGRLEHRQALDPGRRHENAHGHGPEDVRRPQGADAALTSA